MKAIKSPVLNYYELTEAQQTEAFDTYGNQAEELSYVYCPLRPSEVLCVDNFLRADTPGRWHGYYGLSYFSSYAIRLNLSGDTALIAYLHY